MPTISFPSNPSPNDTYTFNNKTWVWTGSAWALSTSGAINNLPIGNVTPSTGAFTTLSATGNLLASNVAATGTVSATGNITGAALSVGTGQITAGNILPAANVTYDLGSTSQRWNDIWLANSTIYLGEANISASGSAVVLPANTTVGGAVITASPLITAIDYPGDDTAADPAGGQTISIEGANFQSGAAVYVDGGLVSVVSFISSSILQFVSPAKSAGSYSLYVVNPNGATAIAVPGMQYSGVPAWTTAAGNIGTPYEASAFATTVVATGDAPITYSVAAGNSLPTSMSLTAANGYLSVATVPVTNNDTTYNFNIVATDAEQQDTPRQFSVTYRTDVVTWSSPANASSYTWTEGQANSVSMTATSAAGRAVSFAVQSGSLPSNVTIAGNLISGTPNAVQSNTSVVVRATAATTNRFADQTFYFAVEPGSVSSVEYLVVAGGGGSSAGGGGAGGYRTGNLAVSTGQAYTVTVGAGGAGATTGSIPMEESYGANGSPSVFDSITSTGGGGGGYYYVGGLAGGSGGGAGWGSLTGGAGTAGQGNKGGDGVAAGGAFGSGGGAGAAGANATQNNGGAGGIGLQSSIDGAATYRAGGGGGGGVSSGGAGGNGGGGNGSTGSTLPIAGTVNSGGGGGGNYYNASISYRGRAGGSGIVIIRYPDSFPAAASTTGSPTVTVAGGYRVYKFTGSGTITF